MIAKTKQYAIYSYFKKIILFCLLHGNLQIVTRESENCSVQALPEIFSLTQHIIENPITSCNL